MGRAAVTSTVGLATTFHAEAPRGSRLCSATLAPKPPTPPLPSMPHCRVFRQTRFRVLPAGGAVGTFAASLEVTNAADNSAQSQPILIGNSDGKVSLAPFSTKDVNVDGIIDVVDVQAAVNLILNLS